MRHKPPRSRPRWLTLLLLLPIAEITAGEEPGTADGPSAAAAAPATARPEGDGTPLESLNRLVRRFDFEEAQTARVPFPLYFKRTIAEDLGFPRFGDLTLTNEAAFSGNWSFRFDLAGGSLSAGIPTGVTPILPLADYAVSTRVRTRGLTHAGARLIAWLYDAAGNPIPQSLAESPVVRTGGSWQTLTVQIRGNYPDAADLVFELQVLQPGQQNRNAAETAQPTLQDVTGSAWFDDVTIWHVPRIELNTGSAHNIITLPDQPALSVLVRDLTNEPLTALLRVENLDGRTVHEESFPAPRGRQAAIRQLPLATCGWYRAELEVRSDRRLVGRRQLDFVVLPEEDRPVAAGRQSLGVILPPTSLPRLAILPELVRRLHAGTVLLSVWDESAEDGPEELARERFAALRRMIERLLDTETEVTFALDSVPRRLAAALGLDSGQVLDLLGEDPQLWRPSLDEVLISFGLRVQRWQLGRCGHTEGFSGPDLEERIEQATAALSPFVPDPIITIPSSAEQQVLPGPPVRSLQVSVPHEISPACLPEYAAPWRAGGRDVHVSFEPAPAALYSPRQQVVDLLLRGLHGWRAGLERMAVLAPWRWREERQAELEPEPAFAAWRGLADALGGRRFAGTMPVAEGIHCWLMEGEGSAGDALVAWRDQRAGDEPAIVRLVLADHAVRLVDPFGNARMIEPDDGFHQVPIGDMPVFVEGINLPLAQFRAGFRIEPSFIPAMHRLHEHDLILRNPWDVAVSGSIHLRQTADCRITPRRQDFVMRSGETIRLPLSVIFDRSIIAGTKHIEAEVNLAADREYRLQVHTDVEVGWKNIEMNATWQVAENTRTGRHDLIITQYITNRGALAVNLDTFLRAPGVGQNRRVITALQPDTTAVKTFSIPGGATLLAGRTVRLGVADRDGVAQLNHVLEIPDLLSAVPPVRQADASDAEEQ